VAAVAAAVAVAVVAAVAVMATESAGAHAMATREKAVLLLIHNVGASETRHSAPPLLFSDSFRALINISLNP